MELGYQLTQELGGKNWLSLSHSKLVKDLAYICVLTESNLVHFWAFLASRNPYTQEVGAGT
jgi:hypothetical protein